MRGFIVCTLPNMRMIKSRKMRCGRRVCGMGELSKAHRHLIGSLNNTETLTQMKNNIKMDHNKKCDCVK